MKEYRTQPLGIEDPSWPCDFVSRVYIDGTDLAVGIPSATQGVYEIVQGMVKQCVLPPMIEPLPDGATFTLMTDKGNYEIEYAVVHSIEVIPGEYDLSAAGMWKVREPGEITERRDDEDVVILNQINADTGDMFVSNLIVNAHNAVVKKLTEINVWRALTLCDLPLRMSKDGLELGDKQLPDYDAGIQKVGDKLSVYGFSMSMPDRIILEYGDDPDIAGRRITITGDNVDILDSKIGGGSG